MTRRRRQNGGNNNRHDANTCNIHDCLCSVSGDSFINSRSKISPHRQTAIESIIAAPTTNHTHHKRSCDFILPNVMIRHCPAFSVAAYLCSNVSRGCSFSSFLLRRRAAVSRSCTYTSFTSHIANFGQHRRVQMMQQQQSKASNR